mmetsp:Transcript_29197/g.59216  ORF Transcript_29197/g.59216 Transcript_29197/m.59216 type:complete len:91 (+) Transcript_29197:203-475(+)
MRQEIIQNARHKHKANVRTSERERERNTHEIAVAFQISPSLSATSLSPSEQQNTSRERCDIVGQLPAPIYRALRYVRKKQWNLLRKRPIP